MAFQDLREWMDRLEVEGELKRIKVEVGWDREIGAIARKVLDRKGPALLFENIKDYKDTFCRKVFTNGLGNHCRVSMALGLKKDSSLRDVILTMKERLKGRKDTVLVRDGPVKQNMLRGDEVDLYRIPVPKWHHLDGGRYINTLCAVVTRDPETRELNIGTYRGMIGGKNLIPVLLAASQHWGHHFFKYRARGESMPVAVIYGWDPALFMVSSLPVQHQGYSEYEITGSLRGAPVELVKCETSDLLVPSWAEMVIEGSISPDPSTYLMEGPFGEYTGYFGGLASPKPVIKVECITFRDDPIFQGTMEGTSPGKWSEGANFVRPGYAAIAWNILESAGVPGILDVYAPQVAGSTNLRVRIKKMYRGHAKQVANVLWGAKISNSCAKHLIVTDEDIDIFDDEAIEWAIAYRVNADMDDIVFFPGTIGSMLDPSVPLEQRDVLKYGQGKWTRVLIDATINWELERQEQYGGKCYPPVASDIPQEDEELIRRRWKEYGLS